MTTRARCLLDDFFDPPEHDAALSVLRAVRALHDDDEAAPNRSHGQVTRPRAFHMCSEKPVADGLYAANIFGPIDDFRCLCGNYDGQEHAGTVCERCGVRVESSEPRSWRFGHLEIGPVVHPSCAGPIADILGLSTDDVMRVAYAEASLREGSVTEVDAGDIEHEHTGVSALASAVRDAPRGEWHERLAAAGFSVDALFVRSVPVPPPSERRLVFEDGDPRATFPSEGSLNDALIALFWREMRRARLVQLDAPPILQVNEERDLQRAFEDLLRHVRLGNQYNGWERLPDAGTLLIDNSVGPDYEENLPGVDEVFGLLWLDEDVLLEQRGRRLRHLDTTTGETLQTLEVPPIQLRSVHDRFVVFAERPSLYAFDSDPPSVCGVEILDLDAGEFLDEVPDGVPMYSVQNEQPEELFLTDARHDRGIALEVCSDRPKLGCYTRDAEYALVLADEDRGRVLELHTGLVCEDFDRRDLGSHNAELVHLSEATGDAEWLDGRPALHRAGPHSWQWLSRGGAVGTGDTLHYRLGFEWCASAFSPDGTRLAVRTLDTEEVVVLESTHPNVLLQVQALSR